MGGRVLTEDPVLGGWTGLRSVMTGRARAPFAVAALVGGVGFGLLAAIQLGAAALSLSLWTIEDPWAMAWRYPALGAALGVALTAGASVCSRWARGARLAAVAALVATAFAAPVGRALASASLRGRQGLPGGRTAALSITAAGLVVLLVFVTRRVCRRAAERRESGAEDLAEGAGLAVGRDALWMAGPCLAAVYLVHVDLLAVKDQAAASGWLGAPALGLLLGAATLGCVAGAWASAPQAGRAVRAAFRVLILLATAGGLAAHRAPEAVSVAEPPPGPNVLLVVLDTLRRDVVSAYGQVQGTTPRLDELAEHGVRFDDCIAPGSWTVPSHASLFTGAAVSRHGTGHFRRSLRRTPAGPGTAELPTLAELLGRRGWETAGFVCNMNVSAAAGFDRGFDDWHEVWRARQGDYDVLAPAFGMGFGGTLDKGGALATRGIVEWITRRGVGNPLAAAAGDRGRARPWFLFVNLLEAHAPYGDVPERHARAFLEHDEPTPAVGSLLADPMAHVYRGGVPAAQAEELRRAYLGAVRYQDELLGRVLDALDESGQVDGTVVVVTSDHGENFGWQGLLGHGQDLNDELLSVPLIVSGPGMPWGAVETGPASLVDVLPTLLALTGSRPLPDDPGRRGVVLAGPKRVADADIADRVRIVEQLPNYGDELSDYRRFTQGRGVADADPAWAFPRGGVYRGADKFVEVDGPVPAALGRRLTRREVGERDPARVTVDDAGLATELSDLLSALRSGWPAAGEATTPPPEVDEETRAWLRSLGYLGGSTPGGEAGTGDGDDS